MGVGGKWHSHLLSFLGGEHVHSPETHSSIGILPWSSLGNLAQHFQAVLWKSLIWPHSASFHPTCCVDEGKGSQEQTPADSSGLAEAMLPVSGLPMWFHFPKDIHHEVPSITIWALEPRLIFSINYSLLLLPRVLIPLWGFLAVDSLICSNCTCQFKGPELMGGEAKLGMLYSIP